MTVTRKPKAHAACRLVLAVGLLIGLSAAVQAQSVAIEPAKLAAIQQLMEVTGSARMGVQFSQLMTQQMFMSIKAAKPDMPPRTFEIIKAESDRFFAEKISEPGGLMEQIYPIYDHHFTLDELRAMLAFYDTPVGKKMVSSLPLIVTEAAQLGQRWGAVVAPMLQQRIDAALKKEGISP